VSAASLARHYARHRFAALFAVLLLTIAGHGFVSALLPAANPLDWLLGASLVALVLSAGRGRLRLALGALAAAFVAMRLVEPFLDHPAPMHAAQTSLGLACLLAAGVAARRALSAGPVDTERIFAALDVYLLVGVAFGVGYWLLETALPGSLALGDRALSTGQTIYFSFVIQTTVGFGDIVPLREQAQGLVIVQGIGGQLYLAVLIARLVGLHSAEAGAPRREGEGPA